MEIKEPVAVFNAVGFKMLIEALQGNKNPVDPEAGESTAVDHFLKGYYKHKEEENSPSYSLPELYEAVFNIMVEFQPDMMDSAKIRNKLKQQYGFERDAKGFSSFMNGVMRNYPIERAGRGWYKLIIVDPKDNMEGQNNE